MQQLNMARKEVLFAFIHLELKEAILERFLRKHSFMVKTGKLLLRTNLRHMRRVFVMDEYQLLLVFEHEERLFDARQYFIYLPNIKKKPKWWMLCCSINE